jgi:uncharacterized protein YecE (DUF72 family)
MSPEGPQFRLGTSGWAHRDWVGRLYALDTSAAEFLPAYARHFDTVEIEHTFFEMPESELVQSWANRTPDGFVFCPCLPRRITHTQRLQNCQELLADFLAVIGQLGDKLGPILVQLPDDFRRDEQPHLEAFLQHLPPPRRFAIEFHHGSWCRETTFQLLERYQVAWVVVDAPFLPRLPRVTADFAYVRWHGYPGTRQRARRQLDPLAALRPWVPILRQLGRQAGDVYGYVRNSFSGYAPRDCQILRELLGAGRGNEQRDG